MARIKRDPRTKEEFLDRILRFDFNGDIRDIGEQPATVVRTGANTLRLRFPTTGQTFDISVHKPRGEQPAVPARASGEARSFARVEPVAEEAPEPARRGRKKQGDATPRQQRAARRQAQA